MADQVTLTAEPRSARGKGEARRLRREGRVPAIAYGSDMQPSAVSVDALALYHALRTDAGLNAVIEVHVGSDKFLALARELQRHPVRRDILHVDLVAIDRLRKVTVDVPLHLVGEAPGTDAGGVIDQVLFTVSVEVLPLEVPDSLQVDVSDMQIGDAKRLEDLPLPEGVELLDDPDSTVVSVYVPAAEELEPAVGEGETGEEAAAEDEAAAADDDDTADEG
jgi:large subunit ribosomal protein L25